MRPFSVTEIPLRGRNLVDASAGTGKTYAIATLFIRLLLETELSPSQLLVVTFTEAATAELRDRIRSRVRECLDAARPSPDDAAARDPTLLEIMARAGDPERVTRRLREALYDFDNVEISTIHGFCQRILMERALESDVTFNSQLYGDARPLIDELVLDFWATHAGPASLELLSYMRGEGTKFGVDMARRLAYTVLRTPQIQVLPATPPSEAPPDVEAFQRQLGAARMMWQRYDVVAIIGDSSVRKQAYNKRYLPQWAKEVGDYFAGPDGGRAALPRCFERFCTARLREAGGSALSEHELFVACDALLVEHQRLSRALAAEALRFKLSLIDYIKRELPRRTTQLRQLSFDDLLGRLHAALVARDGQKLALAIRERYPAALIDEFQDTDPLQLGIFESIYAAPSSSLFLIGDPKQAIYSFRGADVFSYVKAARHTAPERHYTMTTNYRSDPSMVQAVNHLFSSCPHPFLLPDIRFQNVSPRPGAEDVLRSADGALASGLEILLPQSLGDSGPALSSAEWAQRHLPALIADDIRASLASGLLCKGQSLGPGDIAVLTRTNDQAFQIQAALRLVGVPSVVLGDKSVYASEEASDLERLLGAVVEPTNSRLIRAAISTDLLGVTAHELASLDEQEGPWEGWISAFHEWNSTWSQTGFVQMMRSLMSRAKVQERLLARSDGERRMTNLLQLIELLHAASVRGHLGPSGLFTFLTAQRRREIVGMEAESAQIRLESDAEAVKITTMHKSKGLEYPVVYCPYLWHGMLLHQSDEQAPKLHTDGGQLVLDIGSDEREAHLARARFEQLAENLRLLYVALTRARHRCSIVWGRIGRFATSALGYLLHPPPPDELAPDVPAIQDHLARLDDARLLGELEQHAAAAPIVLRQLTARSVPELPERELSPRKRSARRPSHPIDGTWRTSSFSALTSHAPTSTPSEEQIADHDTARTALMSPPEPSLATPELPLSEFPRGTKAGSFFHDILEHYDFVSPRPGPLSKLVEGRLASYRYPVEEWRDRVCEQMFAVLDTPLDSDAQGAPLRLGDVPLSERLSELEFSLPVGSRGRTGLSLSLNARELAQVFRKHPSDALPPSYADSISRLGFIPLRGFLRGFVDLVFRHGERFYLVDYKGNHLGSRASDYTPDALGAAMARGQYFLQYHLYALALHRYLGRRVKAYDYERHFGGAYYLFIKGMGPALGASGVFFEKPPLRRLEALARLLDGQREPS